MDELKEEPDGWFDGLGPKVAIVAAVLFTFWLIQLLMGKYGANSRINLFGGFIYLIVAFVFISGWHGIACFREAKRSGRKMREQIKRDEEKRIARLEKMISVKPSDSEYLKEENRKEREAKMKEENGK